MRKTSKPRTAVTLFMQALHEFEKLVRADAKYEVIASAMPDVDVSEQRGTVRTATWQAREAVRRAVGDIIAAADNAQPTPPPPAPDVLAFLTSTIRETRDGRSFAGEAEGARRMMYVFAHRLHEQNPEGFDYDAFYDACGGH